jgi:hypothetical protein
MTESEIDLPAGCGGVLIGVVIGTPLSPTGPGYRVRTRNPPTV